MQLKKIVATALVTSGMILLTACAAKHKNSSDNMAMDDASANGGAQTAALDQSGNFGGDGGENGQKMASNNKNTYYFDFDKSDIHDTDKPSIIAKANRLSSNPNKKVIVEGHTDPRGSREYNVALGEHRANAVSDMLQSNGASASQVRVVSYGAERLAAAGHNESDYQLDRRAVIATN